MLGCYSLSTALLVLMLPAGREAMDIMCRARLVSTTASRKLCFLSCKALVLRQAWPDDLSRSTTPDPEEFEWPLDINQYDWGDDGPHPEAAVTEVGLHVQRGSKPGGRTLSLTRFGRRLMGTFRFGGTIQPLHVHPGSIQ